MQALSHEIIANIIPLIEIVPDTRTRTVNENIHKTPELSIYIRNNNKFKYNDKKHALSIKGRMTKEEQLQLLELSGEKEYRHSINRLFNKSNPTVGDYLKDIINKIHEILGEEKVLYMDYHYLEDANPAIDVLAIIIEMIKSRKLKAIIVANINKLGDNLESIARNPLGELAIRVKDNEIGILKSAINDIKNKLSLTLNKIDLIVDHDMLLDNNPQKYTNDYDLIVNQSEWRRIIFAGASFPADLRGYPPYGEYEIPRIEWRLWQALLEKHNESNNIYYSDYTIRSSALPASGYVNASANIRYACEDIWFVVKGKSIRHDKNKYKQFHDLSDNITHDKRYAGAEHCFGDKFINDCANKKIGPGNLSSWVTVGETHHITTVVEQLSNSSETLK